VFDVDKAVTYLNSHAGKKTKRKCAHYTTNAIVDSAGGGQPMGRTKYAKNFGPLLEDAGFREVTDGSLQKGDVVVIQSFPGNNAGHMAMYNGKEWVSDFHQGRGAEVYPGPSYRANQPSYKIYRHRDAGKSSGSGVQGVTKQGAQLDTGDDHGVRVGPKLRHLAHLDSNLIGGGKVKQGSGTVYVGVNRKPVSRVTDATTHGPIVIGEDSVGVG
jgi:hypothetical protein